MAIPGFGWCAREHQPKPPRNRSQEETRAAPYIVVAAYGNLYRPGAVGACRDLWLLDVAGGFDRLLAVSLASAHNREGLLESV
jgi:hypothetical protein